MLSSKIQAKGGEKTKPHKNGTADCNPVNENGTKEKPNVGEHPGHSQGPCCKISKTYLKRGWVGKVQNDRCPRNPSGLLRAPKRRCPGKKSVKNPARRIRYQHGTRTFVQVTASGAKNNPQPIKCKSGPREW